MCGVRLANSCAQCGNPISDAAETCGSCGAGRKGAAVGESLLPADAERRQVTVLFSDVVGSTQLSEQMDPEELRQLIRRYHELCALEIATRDGYLAQLLGDGVLAYFGYPIAQGEDAMNAVRTGLGIVERVSTDSELQGNRDHPQLQVRVGIHTGLGIAEAGGEDRLDAVTVTGLAPNVASRVQGHADPNTVLISADTHALVRGFFDCKGLGPHPIRGVSEPLELFRVESESGARTRIDVARPAGLTPLVGREQEFNALLAGWNWSRAGAGQIIKISGEPGIGKSRLVEELTEQVEKDGGTALELRCTPHMGHSALQPSIELLRRGFDIGSNPPPEQQLEQLEEALTGIGMGGRETIALLASLLSIPCDDSPLRGASPQSIRRKTIDLLVDVVRKLAASAPVLVTVEDLHWADPSTLELSQHLFQRIGEDAILVLLTARPEFDDPWTEEKGISRIVLERLPRSSTARIIEHVTEGRTLPRRVLNALDERADGVPLYVEELTKMVLESDWLEARDARFELRGSMPAHLIPTTLRDSLVARLDRVVESKVVLQLGSTLGRRFTYAMLKSVSQLEDASLTRELERLVDARVFFQTGDPPNSVYRFKHALIQEAAYESQLMRDRQRLHRRVAEACMRDFPDVVQTQPELLAHHWAEARDAERAIPFCLVAGERAMQRSAYEEAVGQLEKGLVLLDTLPETADRNGLEIDLYNTLGVARMASQGYAAPAVGRAYERALGLCEHPPDHSPPVDDRKLFAALWGLGTFNQSAAKLDLASELANRRLDVARRIDESGLVLQALEAAGTVSYWRGEYSAAWPHFEAGISLYDREEHSHLANLYGQDAGVVCRANGGQALWFLGEIDRGEALTLESLELAREVGHLYSLALACCFAASSYVLRKQPERVLEFAEEALELSREQEFPFWLGYSRIMRGWAMAARGDYEAGVAELTAGMSSYQGTGAELGGRYCVALLAEIHADAGHVDDALGLLEFALPGLEQNEDGFWLAEVARIKGVLEAKRAKPDPKEAERHFRDAIRIADGQGARMLALRAATDLTRLRQREGDGEAQAILSSRLGVIREGLDTIDVVEARDTLEALT